MKSLLIEAFFDGRPGHEKQTQGIINALSEITPIDVQAVKVSVTPVGYIKNWLSYIFPLYNKAGQGVMNSADLIIGTGSHTHLPMLLHKNRRRGLSSKTARVVTCMTPDALLKSKFDLCCIPMHDEPAGADNVFITQGPPNTVKLEDRHKDKNGLILVGGLDKKSHVWRSGEIVAMVRTIIDKDPDTVWTVSSSPRTPEETCNQLEQIAVRLRNVSFYRSDDTPAGWIEEQYALNQNVWVTADSVSMVYEALTAGCSVGILPVDWLRPENKFNKSLNYLSEKHMIVDFVDWQQGASMPTQKNKQFNESLRCAREILKRWWPDRLP